MKVVKKIKIGLALVAMSVAATLHAEFKAGFARIDITPPLGIPIPGYFHKRIAEGVMDPLCAECVALSDGTNSAVVYCVDNLHLTKPFFEAAFPAITAATGLPRDRIYVHSTHIHTSPADWPRKTFTDEENRLTQIYGDMLVTRLADVGRAALADLAPATIAVARTTCPNVSFIRRYRMKDGSVQTNPGVNNPNVAGPLGKPDETVQVVRFRRTGAPDIAIVNFGTHPDTVHGKKYSADWPGVVRKTFENGIGGGVKCLFLNGAQGDVNHVDPAPSPARKALSKSGQVYLYMGRAVAGAAMKVWDVCEDVPAGVVRGAVTAVSMPANHHTDQEVKWLELFDAGRKSEIPLGHMELTVLTSPSTRARRSRGGPDHYDILVSSVTVGDSLAFAGLPCEPFVDIGRAVKEQSPARMTIVTCLTNGSEGYIPSTAAHNEGGYEGISSRFKAETGDRLVAVQVAQLKKLIGKGE